MDAWSAWTNVVTLLVVGGAVTLVLALVAATAGPSPSSPEARRGIRRAVGVAGALAALVAGVAVAAWAVGHPESWWLVPASWVVWIVAVVLTFLLVALLRAVDRLLSRR